MIKLLLFISLLLGSRGLAQQTTAVDDRDSLPAYVSELKQLHTLPPMQKKVTFYEPKEFCQYQFVLQADHKFQKVFLCCMGRSVEDSGYWEMDRQSRIEVKATKQTLFYYLYQSDDCLFLIEEKERSSFFSIFEQALKKRSNRRPFKYGDEIISITAQLVADFRGTFFFRVMDWPD